MERHGKIVSILLLYGHLCCNFRGLTDCEEKCYKDPVLKDQPWSAYIDRSPGAAPYSVECFNACKTGCGYKFEVPPEKVVQVRPNRPCNPPLIEKPSPRLLKSPSGAVCPGEPTDDMPCTSA